MRLGKQTLVWLGTVFLLSCAGAQAESDKGPGFVGIDFPELFGATPEVEVFLERPLLRMMTAAAGEIEPEIAEIIPELDLIQVQVFEDLPEQSQTARNQVVSEAVGRLLGEGWATIVNIPEEDEQVSILGNMSEEAIQGLAVFVSGEEEFVFLNIVGSIDPEAFGKKIGQLGGKFLGGKLDMKSLGAVLGIIEGDAEPSFKLKGVVKDAKTGEPLAGAKVSDAGYGPEPYKGTLTDASGSYEYSTWPEHHTVIADATGYESLRKTILNGIGLGKDQEVLDFALKPVE